MNSLKEQKTALRQETLARRAHFLKTSPKAHEEASWTICQHLSTLKSYRKAQTLFCFVSFGDEVNTHPLIRQALKEGKRVFVPYVVPKEKTMIPAEITDFDQDLAPGYFGILEPKAQSLRLQKEDLIDLVVAPGVLFDAAGYRIGYGGGFYDRLFQKLSPKVPKIAIGFALQTTDSVPKGHYDLPVDALITEKGIRFFSLALEAQEKSGGDIGAKKS
ncbi:5-formyltetrahydrofolate cyclo-ligase [Clostridiaceae bacterium JG1575]|nr:5-formyltetrahydrofolate cyclo-ligase [Clostridiaceae bacterium JG1575]